MPKKKTADRRRINVLLQTMGVYGFQENVNDLIEFLRSIKERAPVEYQDTVYINAHYTSYRDDETNYDFDVYYHRPETDDEMNARIAKEKTKEEMVKKKELAMLEKLKKKYKE